MTTPVHFQSFYLGLLCFRAVFLEGSNATLNILRRSSNTIHSFSLHVSGVQNLLMSVVTKSCWHQTAVMWPMRNEPVSSDQFFPDRYSYLHKNNQAHTLAGKSQELKAVRTRSSFLSPEAEQELRQLCPGEGCITPLTKKQGISIRKYVKSVFAATACCPEPWSHKLLNVPECTGHCICSQQTKVLLLYKITNPESRGELSNLHHNIHTTLRRARE